MPDTELSPHSPVPADDIESLIHHLPKGQFTYRDIAAEEARHTAHKRWPLLAELTGTESSRSTAPHVSPAP